jgi:hypothetical protein
LILLLAFLHVNYKKAPLKEKLKRIDWTGNGIIVGALFAIIFALTYAGVKYAWSSWHIIVPLIVGFAGIVAFHLYEASKFCPEPTMPTRLFSNRTSLFAFFLTFIHSILTLWTLYFLPVYFQAVLRSTPTRAGVQLLPTVMFLMPFAIMSGLFISKVGLYRPMLWSGFALMTIGFGLFTLLDAGSSMATWVCLQLVEAAGTGLVATSLLPAVQAGLPESDTASSTATWAYVRSFGAVWGVTIPASIFNNRFDQLLYRISDATVRETLAGGEAYAHASKAFVGSFAGTLQREIIDVYSDSLELTWFVAIAIAGATFFTVFIQKDIPLRTELDTEYGLKTKEKKKAKDAEKGAAVVDAGEK